MQRTKRSKKILYSSFAHDDDFGRTGAGKSTVLCKIGLESFKGKKGNFKHQAILGLLELKKFTDSKKLRDRSQRLNSTYVDGVINFSVHVFKNGIAAASVKSYLSGVIVM